MFIYFIECKFISIIEFNILYNLQTFDKVLKSEINEPF